jgi:hypothetical protein
MLNLLLPMRAVHGGERDMQKPGAVSARAFLATCSDCAFSHEACNEVNESFSLCR